MLKAKSPILKRKKNDETSPTKRTVFKPPESVNGNMEDSSAELKKKDEEIERLQNMLNSLQNEVIGLKETNN